MMLNVSDKTNDSPEIAQVPGHCLLSEQSHTCDFGTSFIHR